MKYLLIVFALSLVFHPASAQSNNSGSGHGNGTLEATDTSGNAGTRKSSKKLVMVKEGLFGKREAELEFKYDQGASQPSGFPIWSGDGLQNPNPGDLKVVFEHGSTSTIKAEYRDGSSEDVEIEVIEDKHLELELSDKDGIGKTINDKLDSLLQKVFGKDSGIKATGSASLEIKRVDFYDNAEEWGGYVKAEGSFKISAGELEGEWRPPVPLGTTGLVATVFAKTSGVTLELSGSGTLDQSKANEGSFTAKFDNTTSLSFGPRVSDPAKVISIIAEASVAIEK